MWKPYNYLCITTKIPSSLGTVLLPGGPPKGRCAGVVKHWSHNQSPSGTSVRFTQSLHILSTRRCEVIYVCVIIAFWVMHRVCSCASFHTSETTCHTSETTCHTSETTCHTSRNRACSSLLPHAVRQCSPCHCLRCSDTVGGDDASYTSALIV